MAQQLTPPTAAARAEIYERELVPAIFGPWANELIARATPQPGQRVLDVACGTGAVARLVAPLVGPSGEVIGLDVNPALLGVARSLPAPAGAAIAWREGDAAAVPFPEAAFDLALCQQGLPFVADQPAAAREMRRVLVPDGRVGIAVWRDLERQPVYAALNQAIERRLGTTALAAAYSLGDADELRALLTGAGFREVTIDPVVRTARFASAARFVRLATRAVAALRPEVAQMDPAAHDALVADLSRDVDDTFRPYRDGEALAFPMEAHIAVARA